MEFKYEKLEKLVLSSNKEKLPIPSSVKELLEFKAKIESQGYWVKEIELSTNIFNKIKENILELEYYAFLRKNYLCIAGCFVMQRFEFEDNFIKIKIDSGDLFDNRMGISSDKYVELHDLVVKI